MMESLVWFSSVILLYPHELDSHVLTSISRDRRYHSLGSSHPGEVPEHNTHQNTTDDPSPAVETEQSSPLATLPTSINTAFETVQKRIDGLHPLSEFQEEIASLSEGLHSIRQLALELGQTITATHDLQQDSEPFYESTAEVSPTPFDVFNDANADESRSEDSEYLVEPSHEMVSHFYSQRSDNKENESCHVTALPDWACTVTAGGYRVPLFWEGGDMGYFAYHQEQMKAVEGVR